MLYLGFLSMGLKVFVFVLQDCEVVGATLPLRCVYGV